MLSTAFDPSHPLVHGHPPTWASGWGQDRYGVFVEITVNDVTQRLRWIPKGSFMMGSPQEEVGRVDHEGPQHLVYISSGYWLFDTLVTQSLWQSVMGGKNPSRFQHPQRPVEQVSWHDAQRFTQRINELISGLELCLPTEAQWEYACRANSKWATWVGDLVILSDNNAPILDEIAWYGGNCGCEYDLEEGEDSSGWPNKQSAHSKAGTRIVGQKRANPWGLYDMIGNVWEWCADDQREYSEVDMQDPLGPVDGGGSTLRGGSWSGFTAGCRAAARVQEARDFRSNLAGFRCVRC